MHPEMAWRYLILLTLMGGAFAGLLCVLIERALKAFGGR